MRKNFHSHELKNFFVPKQILTDYKDDPTKSYIKIKKGKTHTGGQSNYPRLGSVACGQIGYWYNKNKIFSFFARGHSNHGRPVPRTCGKKSVCFMFILYRIVVSGSICI